MCSEWFNYYEKNLERKKISKLNGKAFEMYKKKKNLTKDEVKR